MDWIYIVFAFTVGCLIGSIVTRALFDLYIKRLIKANLNFLEANIALYKNICAIYLDPMRDVLKESNSGKRHGKYN